MRRSELVTVPSFSPQAAAGSSTCAYCVVSVWRTQSETMTSSHFSQRAPHLFRIRQADRRVGGHDPQHLDLALLHRVEQVHGLEALLAGDSRGLPEVLHLRAMRRVVELDVRGQLVGEPADLAPAHGVRLAGERERPHAGAADAAGEQVAVDDGVDLVGAARRLVHALREQRDHALGAREQLEELRDLRGAEPACSATLATSGLLARAARQRFVRALGVAGDELRMRLVVIVQIHQQAVEQHAIGAGAHGQVQVGEIGAGGAARVDEHHAQIGMILPSPAPAAGTAPDGTRRAFEPTSTISSARSRSS